MVCNEEKLIGLNFFHPSKDLATRMPGSNAWHGKIAEQFGYKRPAQYLQGGCEQVIINWTNS